MNHLVAHVICTDERKCHALCNLVSSRGWHGGNFGEGKGLLKGSPKSQEEDKAGNDSPFQGSYVFLSSGENSGHRQGRGKLRQEKTEQGSKFWELTLPALCNLIYKEFSMVIYQPQEFVLLEFK